MDHICEPDIALVGHVAEDVLILLDGSHHESIGGLVSYASAALYPFDVKTGLVSSVGRDFPDRYEDYFRSKNVDLLGLHKDSDYTTQGVLKQIDLKNREYYVKHMARKIVPEDIPEEYLGASLFYFGPVNGYSYAEDGKKQHDEIPPQTVKYVAENSDALIMLDAQGYTRVKDLQGKNHNTTWDDKNEFYPYIDILKINDVPEASMLSGGYCDPIKAATKIYSDLSDVRDRSGEPIVIVTMGKKGSLVVVNNTVCRIPSAVPDRVVDPTGAGDTYGAAFVHYYLRTQDVIYSATMATVAASYIIECVGSSVIPTLNQIKRRYLDQRERIQPVEVGDV